MTAKPSQPFSWATSAAAGDITAPLAPLVASGYHYTDKPAHDNFNWMFNLIGQWTSFLDQSFSAAGAFLVPVLLPAATAAGAGFNLAPGVAPSAPNNGDLWTTASALQAQLGGATYTAAFREAANIFSQPQSFVNANSQILFGTAAGQGYLAGQATGAGLSFGASEAGGTWIAQVTSPSLLSLQAGQIVLAANTGLTVGNAFTPTTVATFAPTQVTLNTPTLKLNAGTQNTISFNGAGLGAPTFTSSSAGTKLLLWPSVDATHADYAIGVANSQVWFSLPNAGSSLNWTWFGGTTGVMSLTADGFLTLTKQAQASTAEQLAKFLISDDAVGKLEFWNASATDATFVPEIRGTSPGSNWGLALTGVVTTDSGASGALNINVRTTGNAALATRPIAVFNNNGTAKVTIGNDGSITSAGAGSFTTSNSQILFGSASSQGYIFGSGGGAFLTYGADATGGGTAWTARQTSVSLVKAAGAAVTLYANTGLTVGNTFTPTQVATFGPTSASVVGTFGAATPSGLGTAAAAGLLVPCDGTGKIPSAALPSTGTTATLRTFTAAGGTKTSATTTRSGGAVVANGTQIFFIGGDTTYGGTTATGVNEMYDTTTNTWTTKAAKTTALYYIKGANVGGVIYIPGGYSGSTLSAVMEAYNVAGNSWSSKTAMPTASSNMGVASSGTTVYTFGASQPGDVSTVYAYDTVGNTWTTKTSMPAAAEGMAGDVISGVIYATGGINGSTYATACYAYNISGNTWSTKTPMPGAARAYHGAKAINGLLHVFGGKTTGGALITSGTFMTYNPTTDSWGYLPEMPTPRMYLDGDVVNGVLYMIGGQTASANVATNEAFDTGGAGLITATGNGIASAYTPNTTLRNLTTGAAGVSIGFQTGEQWGIGGWTSGTLQAVSIS
jgi:hypothetical protein